MKNEREEVIKKILEGSDNDDLLDVDEEVIHELVHETVSKDVHTTHLESSTFGQRLSDRISAFVGSWTFILSAVGIIICWAVVNSIMKNPFDPYPFILLNLFLSCVAAIQGPVIMMSQNRQEEKDRRKSDNDYKVNLKSEIIVKHLHARVDQLAKENEQIIKNQEEIIKLLKENNTQYN